MSPKSWILWLTVVAFAAAWRVLPHPPNVAPLAAVAIFSGMCWIDRRTACLLPWAALALGDFLRWCSEGTPLIQPLSLVVYLSLLGSVAIGFGLRRRAGAGDIPLFPLLGAVVGSSLTFFLLSNAGVWWVTGWYPRNGSGLAACFVAALPFLPLTLGGDLLFGSGGWLAARFLGNAQRRASAARSAAAVVAN